MKAMLFVGMVCACCIRFVSAQTQVSLGVAASYGQSLYTTYIPAGISSARYPDSPGPTFVPIAIATHVRIGDSDGLH